jgi:hypothetical protein
VNRTWLIVAAAVVVMGAAATGATIVLTGNTGKVAVSSARPSATAEQTSVPSSLPSPAVPAASAPASPHSVKPSPAASPAPSGRGSASAIKCDSEPRFCSATDGNTVGGGKLTRETDDNDPSYADSPSIEITSESRKDDGTRANIGDEVGSIHVEVVVRNDTSRTFVFKKREIVLDIYRNGKRYDRLVTSGPGFEMTPGGKMTAQFDRPIVEDGNYAWRAKTSYYAK